jgi:hypothetical protein
MGSVQRGVVRGSNKEGPGGDHRNNSFASLAGGASPISPNEMKDGDRRAGSFPLAGGAPAIARNMERFDVSQVLMPQPASAIEPGKGQVPVNPFLSSGATARVAGQVADEARPR